MESQALCPVKKVFFYICSSLFLLFCITLSAVDIVFLFPVDNVPMCDPYLAEFTFLHYVGFMGAYNFVLLILIITIPQRYRQWIEVFGGSILLFLFIFLCLLDADMCTPSVLPIQVANLILSFLMAGILYLDAMWVYPTMSELPEYDL